MSGRSPKGNARMESRKLGPLTEPLSGLELLLLALGPGGSCSGTALASQPFPQAQHSAPPPH